MTMRLLLTLALMLSLTTGCNLVYKQNIQQGNAIEQEDLDKLRIGMTQNQVAFLLGTPAIRDPFHRDRWDFVSTFSRRGEEAVMRKVTLYFENGLLSEMIGVEGDEFIFEEEEEPTEPEVTDGESESTPAEVTPVAAPVTEEAAFEESLAEPAETAAEDVLPESEGVPSPTSAPEPEISDVEVAPAPAPLTETSPAESGGWVIQLGAFDSNENAQGVLDRLVTAGIDAEITEQVTATSGTRYLVRKQGIQTRAEAERLLEEIASGLGINGFLVPPGQ